MINTQFKLIKRLICHSSLVIYLFLFIAIGQNPINNYIAAYTKLSLIYMVSVSLENVKLTKRKARHILTPARIQYPA